MKLKKLVNLLDDNQELIVRWYDRFGWLHYNRCTKGDLRKQLDLRVTNVSVCTSCNCGLLSIWAEEI